MAPKKRPMLGRCVTAVPVEQMVLSEYSREGVIAFF